MIKLENAKQLEELVKGDVVVDFFATWCGPCKMLMPVLEGISKEKTTKFVKVDIDEYRKLAIDYGVMAVPTVIVFKDGKEVKRFSGFKTAELVKAQLAEAGL